MRSINYGCLFLILCGMVLINPACAQNLHQRNENILAEQSLVEKSTVLLNNQQQIIPLKSLEHLNIASIHFGFAQHEVFDSLLQKYNKVNIFSAATYKGAKNLNNLADDLKFYNVLVIQVAAVDLDNALIREFISGIIPQKQIILAVFGEGRALKNLNRFQFPIIWTDRQSAVAAAYSAQLIFGGVAAKGKLSNDLSVNYQTGSGFFTTKTRLQYTVPEDAGLNALDLQAIDGVVREALNQRATPGAVVLVAKDGKVIFNKAYGYHTYDNAMPDKVSDIFDLASVTKTSATTLEVMRLMEQQKINLDSTAGTYLALARQTDKKNILIREFMLHQAGLTPFIAFYKNIKPVDFTRDSSAAYPTKVADNYYLRKDYYKDVMWPQMLNSPLRTRGKYVYSDLSMYFMKEVVETVSAEPLNEYVQREFYDPLGMQTAGFLPRNRFSKEQIIPTENDKTFRLTLLEGYVHDQGAAMAGGVSGHAGLFSSANDMGILYQMLLNGGSYGGTQYFKPETVSLFTSKQSAVSRRGLGFDRRDPDGDKDYPSKFASAETFGHTGYTGTCVWVDPKHNLVYVFLSNRVHPSVNDKLSSLSIRGRILDIVYKAALQNAVSNN
ncbi:MAG: serine hydrolase domain-containing protein [Sphingobacteriaceae bacterium]